ncbi:hypothetical protein BVRB_9g212370 [Beta vulgaris subsp. vulgaris]|nr:hypothetical protein BVRB_9g212370 [Beta vulgaris subsp. vulgaris]
MATTIFSKNELALLLIVSFFFSVDSQLHHMMEYCGNDDSENTSMPNIDQGIKQLISEASNTYYSTTNSTGAGLDRFNAFFSCRYDVTPQTCQSCVSSAAERVYECLPETESSVYYEECTLHYSNRSNFSVIEDLSPMAVYNSRTIKGEGQFLQTLYNTINDLIGEVISKFPVSSRYFAMKKAKYSSRESIYALAQCNPDMMPANCSTCLHYLFTFSANDPSGVDYAQIVSPICRLSYLFTAKELSHPWSFADNRPPVSSSRGIRASSIFGGIIAIIFSVAVSLSFLL